MAWHGMEWHDIVRHYMRGWTNSRRCCKRIAKIRPGAFQARHVSELCGAWPGRGLACAPILQQKVPDVALAERAPGRPSQMGESRFGKKNWDNHFSGDNICNWMGENKFGFMSTVARNKLPRGMPAKCFCKETTSNAD